MDEQDFYRSAAWYDQGYGWASDDISFWLSYVEQIGARRVLELGCGTGRVTLPLARWGVARGLSLVGIDLSPEMLAVAEGRLAAEPEAARAATRLLVADMRAFTLDERFDLICVPFNTLGHLHTVEDQLACLGAARRHLAPGGRLAVDVAWPSLDELAEAARPQGRAHLDGTTLDPATSLPVTRYRRVHYDPISQAMTTVFTEEWLDGAGQAREERRRLHLHVYTPRELELLFRLAGYRIEGVHGDYDLGPLTGESMQIVVIGVAHVAGGGRHNQ